MVQPLDGGRSRLIARLRGGAPTDAWGRTAATGFWEPAHLVMERKILLKIKRLAETES